MTTIEITKITVNLYAVVVYHGNGNVTFPLEGTAAQCHAFVNGTAS